MPTSDVAALKASDYYRQSRQNLFATEGSFQWYLRRHKAELIAAGALLLIAGRWQIDAEKFDAFVLAAGAGAAKRQLGREVLTA